MVHFEVPTRTLEHIKIEYAYFEFLCVNFTYCYPFDQIYKYYGIISNINPQGQGT